MARPDESVDTDAAEFIEYETLGMCSINDGDCRLLTRKHDRFTRKTDNSLDKIT